MIKRLPSGRWQVDIRQGGRGSKRVRKRFDSKADANRYLQHMLADRSNGEAWSSHQDKRTLQDLVDLWFLHHGHSLRDGESRKIKLTALVDRLRNPSVRRFSPSDFAEYRLRRMADGISANTVNHEQAYLKAVFNELARQGLWTGANPMDSVRRLKLEETELAFLAEDQIDELLFQCSRSSNPSVYYVARLALATGARWSEAEGVTRNNFTPYRVTYNATKSGKSRSVPLDRGLYDELLDALPFESCYSAFRSAIDRAGIQLPKGQLTHICRHTFASHFVMNGGHILTLQKVLGHSDLKLTMRYAHLAPEYLNEVIEKGPWAICGHSGNAAVSEVV